MFMRNAAGFVVFLFICGPMGWAQTNDAGDIPETTNSFLESNTNTFTESSTNYISESATTPPQEGDALERRHKKISRYLTRLAERLDRSLSNSMARDDSKSSDTFDRYLGNRRVDDEENRTRLRITPVLGWREDEGLYENLKFGISLALPRTEDKLHLVVENFNDDADVLEGLDRARAEPRESDEESEQVASLRFSLFENMKFKTTLDTGLRFRPEPIPRARLKFTALHGEEPFRQRATQSFFWQSDDGVGEKTQFDVDYYRRERFLYRWTTSFLWSEVSDGVEMGEILSYYKTLSKRRTIGVRVGGSGHIEPTAQVDEYTIRFPYRQRIWRWWLYLKVEPGVDFPRDRDFAETPFINVELDITFGDNPDEKN